jgi:hypothetical protein
MILLCTSFIFAFALRPIMQCTKPYSNLGLLVVPFLALAALSCLVASLFVSLDSLPLQGLCVPLMALPFVYVMALKAKKA